MQKAVMQLSGVRAPPCHHCSRTQGLAGHRRACVLPTNTQLAVDVQPQQQQQQQQQQHFSPHNGIMLQQQRHAGGCGMARHTCAAAAAGWHSPGPADCNNMHRRQQPHALSAPQHDPGQSRGQPYSPRLHGPDKQPPQQQRRHQHSQQQQQHISRQHLQLLSEGPGQEKRPQPEAPSTSAGPTQRAGGGSGPSKADSSSSSKPVKDSVDDEVDQALEKLWANIKQDLKKELPPDQASMLDRWSPSDISTDKVFREMANHQLGPFLQSMGIDEDPYEFFLDLFRLALVFQLVAAGLVFYTVELGLGGDAGDAFRAVGGLLLGYTLRLVIKVEQLAWPIYNGLVQLLISEGATYEIPPASAEEQRDTLNRLGVALAVAFLVPKFVFGFGNEECWQIVVPMLGGLFYFDVAYMFGLLIKLSMSDGAGDDRS